MTRSTTTGKPRWSPHTDPRLDALAAGFALLLGSAVPDAAPIFAIEELPR
jgi:hypothetical protein